MAPHASVNALDRVLEASPASPPPDADRSTQSSATNVTSRRTSTIMPPPPLPPPSMSTNLTHDQLPVRHPRPLTAAELYLECEKEQEAVVNRLTRELTALRAQSASVASNASSMSSTSANASILPVDISDPNPTHQMVGATHPTPSRSHRSSSSVSGRGMPIPSAATATANAQTHASALALAGISQASMDRAAAVGDRSSLSRAPSFGASGNSTPARRSLDIHRGPAATYPRPSISREHSSSAATVSSLQAQTGTPAPTTHSSSSTTTTNTTTSPPSVASAMQHYADTTAYRTEMEIVKAENEALRQRVRALERALRGVRRDSSTSEHFAPPHPPASQPHQPPHHIPASASRENLSSLALDRERDRDRDRSSSRFPSFTSPPASAGLGAWDGGVGGVAGPRERSESQSTTASSRRAVGVVEDEVRVGESASSAGVGRESRQGN